MNPRTLIVTLCLLPFAPPPSSASTTIPPVQNEAAALETANGAKRAFDLPAAAAVEALQRFVSQSGVQLLFAVDEVAGVRTREVRGEFQPREALDRLLAGTELTAVQAQNGSIAVRRRAPAAQASSSPAPAAPVAQPASDAEEAVVLSPFTVSTERDSGYAAASTLAGTRLNTPLRDVAAAITVVTPEFMNDFGAFTLQDVISFTPNAELNVSTFNSANNGAESARIRGVRVDEGTQDFFPNFLPIDAYSIEQISINRGPNSLLFGVGNPAGTLTGTSKRAFFKNSYEAAASVDRWGGWRASSDFNQVVIPDRLALRLALLRRETNSFVEPAYCDEDRFYLAGTLKVSKRRAWSTTLRFHVEMAEADRVLPNLRTAIDLVTPWLGSGSNLVTGVQPARAGVALPPGVIRAAGVNQIVVVDGSPTPVPMLNWINTAQGGIVGLQNRSLAAGGPVPFAINYNGPTRSADYVGESFRFFLEQELGRNTSLELAYGQSERDFDWIRSAGGDQVLVDANLTLPDGTPNPNAGRYYTQGTNRVQRQIRYGRQLRLTVSQLLDLQETHAWLGRHRFALLLSRDYATNRLNDFFEVNGTPLPGYPSRFDNAQNRIFRRSYLFQGAGDVWQSGRDFEDIAPINSGGVTSYYFNDRPLRNDDRTDSLVLAVQSNTFNNRLATTLGYRWDDLQGFSLDSALSARRPNGEAPAWQEIPLEAAPTSRLNNGTLTAGFVWHALSWLSLQGNQSETSTAAGNNQDMYGRTLPVSMGTGEDYGVKFSFFESRLTGSLTRYKSTQDDDVISSVQNLGPRISEIGRALGNPVLAAVSDPRDTQDVVATGYEFEMIFNPTRAWRIAANLSRNDNVLSNVNSRAARFLEEEVYPLEAASGAVVLSNGRTVAQEIADFRTSLRNSKTAVEGRQSEELREWNANLVTNYRLGEGRFAGLSFGGNFQYRGPSVIGAIIDPVTSIPDFANPIEGRSYTLVGLHLRYDRRIFDRYDLRVGLHLRNVFNDGPLIEKTASSADGAVLTWQQIEPRSWLLSTSVRF